MKPIERPPAGVPRVERAEIRLPMVCGSSVVERAYITPTKMNQSGNAFSCTSRDSSRLASSPCLERVAEVRQHAAEVDHANPETDLRRGDDLGRRRRVVAR